MAYYTGPVSTISQFLGSLASALNTEGWTIHRNITTELIFRSPAGKVWALRLAQGSSDGSGGYDNVIPNGSGLYIYAPTSYAAGSPAHQQPNATFVAPSRGHWHRVPNAGPYVRYHFFIGNTHVHAVLEHSIGMFAHMHLGELDKRGLTYTGGQYVQANGDSSNTLWSSTGKPWAQHGYSSTNGQTFAGATQFTLTGSNPIGPNGCVFLNDFEGRPGRWAFAAAGVFDPSYSVDSPGYVSLGSGILSGHPDVGQLLASANDATGDMILVPPTVYMRGAQQRIYLLGEVPEIAYCDMIGGVPGMTVFFGLEEWMVFPLSRYDPTDGTATNSSATQAIAYKVVR